jgi:hypothetical protein
VPHIHAAGPHNVTERGKCRETVAGPTPARSAISAKVVGTTPFSSWSRIVAATIRSRTWSRASARFCIR